MRALETWAIVVAAGSGERLGADRPKAFVKFGERTLVAASLERSSTTTASTASSWPCRRASRPR